MRSIDMMRSDHEQKRWRAEDKLVDEVKKVLKRTSLLNEQAITNVLHVLQEELKKED